MRLPVAALRDAGVQRLARWRRAGSRTSRRSSPTANVRAASATQPSSVTPTSIEMMSPPFRRYGPGIPCTIIAFGEAQIEPGKPR